MSFCPMRALQASSPEGRKELDEDAMKQRWRRKKLVLYVETDKSYVGQDPECATQCNPSGLVYEEIYIVCVVINDGEIYRHFKAWPTSKEANEFLQRVETATMNGQELDMSHWEYERLAYGSKAYRERGGEEELIAFERKCDEDDAMFSW